VKVLIELTVIRLGAGNSAERNTQAGGRRTRANSRTIGRNDRRFGRRRLRVVFADLSQRVLRRLSAETRLHVHHARQRRLRRACQLSRYVGYVSHNSRTPFFRFVVEFI